MNKNSGHKLVCRAYEAYSAKKDLVNTLSITFRIVDDGVGDDCVGRTPEICDPLVVLAPVSSGGPSVPVPTLPAVLMYLLSLAVLALGRYGLRRIAHAR